MNYRKDLRKLAAEYGYDIQQTNGGHLRLTKPGHPVVFTAMSASDHRALKNIRALLRRHEQS